MWDVFLDVLFFSLGFAACWFAKDRILLIAQGASTVAADLRVKAAKVEATLTTVKAAL